MTRRIPYGIAVLCLVSLCGVAGAVSVAVNDSAGDTRLQIHLPREVTVEGNELNLAKISIIRGTAPMIAKAGQIRLGHFSAPGQKVVLDRPTILSRLATTGISGDQVRLTGADAVTVRRQQQIIEVDDFVEAGQHYLGQLAASRSVCEIIPVTRPKDFVLSTQPKAIQLVPQLVRGSGRGYVIVRIRVMADGEEVTTQDVSFRLKYQAHRMVAAQQIPEGAPLTPENVKIESVVADQPEPLGWKPPYGAVATRTLAANAEIRASMLTAPQSSTFVRRNETVMIRIERPGILITAMGTTLQEGRAGEYVKVRNADSHRVIVCKVMPDGSVEPAL